MTRQRQMRLPVGVEETRAWMRSGGSTPEGDALFGAWLSAGGGEWANAIDRVDIAVSDNSTDERPLVELLRRAATANPAPRVAVPLLVDFLSRHQLRHRAARRPPRSPLNRFVGRGRLAGLIADLGSARNLGESFAVIADLLDGLADGSLRLERVRGRPSKVTATRISFKEAQLRMMAAEVADLLEGDPTRERADVIAAVASETTGCTARELTSYLDGKSSKRFRQR